MGIIAGMRNVCRNSDSFFRRAGARAARARRTVVAGAAGTFLVLAAAPSLAEPSFAAPIVELGEVRTAPLHSTLELEATLEAVRQSTVSAQVSGNFVERLVSAGDRVRAGQPLARIDERDAQAALARSEAAIAQARAERIDAQGGWNRSRALVDRGFLSTAALDASEARLRIAQAAERQAIAGARQAALARNFTTIVAPYDGVVLATHVDAGDLAVPGRPVATVYEPGALRAVVHVPLSLLPAAQDAKRVEVRFASGQTKTPVLRVLVPGIDPVAQTRELRLEFDAPAMAPGVPGERVRVRFAGVETMRRTVPRQAVLRRGELDAVYVAGDDRFVLRAVRLGAVHGDRVEVLGGLVDGERVALDPVRAGLAGAAPRVAAY